MMGMISKYLGRHILSVLNSGIHVYSGQHVYYFFQKFPLYTFIRTPRLLGTGEYPLTSEI